MFISVHFQYMDQVSILDHGVLKPKVLNRKPVNSRQRSGWKREFLFFIILPYLKTSVVMLWQIDLLLGEMLKQPALIILATLSSLLTYIKKNLPRMNNLKLPEKRSEQELIVPLSNFYLKNEDVWLVISKWYPFEDSCFLVL